MHSYIHITYYILYIIYIYAISFSGVSWFLITLHAAFYNIDAVLNPAEEELNTLIMEEV